MIPDSSHLAPVASTSAQAFWAFAGAGATVSAWIVVAVCVARSVRLQGGEPGARRLDRWGGLALVCQLSLALVPMHRRFDDPLLIPRAVAAVALASLAAAVALWEVTARMRYRDRSPRVSDPRHFLTYGPYRHLRRPHELVAILLVIATACALPVPTVFLPFTLVSIGAFLQRARWYDRAAAGVYGDAYAAYRIAVPLLVPRRATAQRPGT